MHVNCFFCQNLCYHYGINFWTLIYQVTVPRHSQNSSVASMSLLLNQMRGQGSSSITPLSFRGRGQPVCTSRHHLTVCTVFCTSTRMHVERAQLVCRVFSASRQCVLQFALIRVCMWRDWGRLRARQRVCKVYNGTISPTPIYGAR